MQQVTSLYAEGRALIGASPPHLHPPPYEPIVTIITMMPQTSLHPQPDSLVLSALKSNITIPFRSSPNYIHIKGVFHAHDSNGILPSKHLWINPIDLWPSAIRCYQNLGYNIFQFTEFSSPDRWIITYPQMPLEGTITVDTVTDPTHVSQDGQQDSNKGGGPTVTT